MAKTIRSVTLVAAIGLTLAGCGAAPPPSTATPTPGHQWSYSGDTGPKHWSRIAPECGASQQSPVDIVDLKQSDDERWAMNYSPFRIVSSDDGHGLALLPAGDSSAQEIAEEDDTSRLRSFHFHTPSEHTISGDPFDAELHLVHKDDDGDVAVVGILIEEGNHNPALAPTIVGNQAGSTSSDVVDLAELVPTTGQVARYDGSLTTPPCSEGVDWRVFTAPIEASKQQLESLRKLYPSNARPAQPHNGRVIESVPLPAKEQRAQR